MARPERRTACPVRRTSFLFPLSLLIFFLSGLSRSVAPEPWSAPVCDTAYAQDTPRLGGELSVFAAASLTEPFTEMGKRLEMSHPGLKVVYNFGGSQALRTQLEQGAQADVFASADAFQMEQAKKSEVVQGETPIFAKNRLVVITPKANPGKVAEFRDLARPGLRLDLANAKVPVGNYSRQAFAKASAEYGADFEKSVLGNIVSEEENVKQVVTKVQLGEADAGIVYVSDITPKVSKDVLTVAIPDAYNQSAAYPVALTKGAQNRAAADAFISFMLSAEGQVILKAHNFIPVKE
ncbi:MAG TPA: molybdate ABC transporter substrate-binding protein [Candidatus Binatia bacterium]|nr:molybdate ABC transporter substrate-binding protein [Candidatus Binatia bacterium]